MARELEGQVAIVTGGGRGIGRAIAEGLASAGAAVAVGSRTRRELDETVSTISNGGGIAIGVVTDVRDPADVKRLAGEAARLGNVTLLVNAAGTPGPVGADWDVDADDWWECIDVSVRGAFLCAQAVLPGMIERRAGRVIQVASTSGTRPVPLVTATSIAKTALIRLAEGLAVSAAPHGVSVFAIHPGVVRTKLLESYGFNFPDDAYSAPEESANLCVQLASGAYDSLSGRFIQVGDDLDELVGRAGAENPDLLTLRILT